MNDYRRAVFVCFVTNLSTAYTAVYPFTYLPDMILWFGYKEEEKGFYAGFVASGYFAGSLLFSYFWGWLSDRSGYRPVLVFLLLCTGVFCLLYGFCTNLYISLTIRICDGAVNGINAVINAILYDHSNNDNQAFAASIAACAWGLGICLGPLIAGFLAEPATKYPKMFNPKGLFGRFPYLIPSLVGFGISLIAAFVVFLVLPSFSTNKERYLLLDDEHIELDVRQQSAVHASESEYKTKEYTEIKDAAMCSSTCELPSSVDEEPTTSTRSSGFSKLKDETTPLCKDRADNRHALLVHISYLVSKLKSSNMFIICQYSGVPLVLIVNMMYHFTTVGLWELVPIWLSTTKDLGGLGFTSDRIGLFTGTVSLIGLILQALLVVQLEKRLGAILSYIICAFMLSVSIQLTTLSRLLESEAAMWVTIYVNNTILSTTLPATLAMITVITNNCAPVEHVGALNGLAQTLGGVMRAVAPVVGGNIFSASITSSIGPPIDPSTAFVVFGLIMWLSIIVVYFFPRDFNSQYMK